MPSLKQDDNEEQLLTDGQVHASAAMMEEERGDDNNQRSVAISVDDDSGITPSAITDVAKQSTVDIMNNIGDAKVHDKVEGSDATMEELEEDGPATTTRISSSSTNEENNIIFSSKEFSTKSGNQSDESHLFDTVAKEQGVNAAAKDYFSGEEEEGENHDAGALDRFNESALKFVDSGNDSNQRLQYNQSFLSSSTQSNGTFTRNSRNEKQDEYVKKGARVKALLASALQAVADGLASRAGNSKTVDRNNSNDGDETDAEKHPTKADADFVHVQDLAQKKSQECITLKRVSACVRMNYYVYYLSTSLIISHYLSLLKEIGRMPAANSMSSE